MSALSVGILFSLAILITGIVCLAFLVKSYKGRLLVNFTEKVQMTFWLAVIFAGFFLVGNLVISRYVLAVKGNFSWYLQHPVVLAREGLIFFILNAFLLLSCRSFIKSLVNFR